MGSMCDTQVQSMKKLLKYTRAGHNNKAYDDII